MAVWGLGMDALTLGRTPTQTSQVRFGARLIQEDQLGRIQAGLALAPEPTRPRDVRALLLAGAECLFLYVSPIFHSTTWIACNEQCSRRAWRNSLSVRSFFLPSRERI